MEILRVENLSFSYPEGKIKSLDNISFSLNEGDFAVVCGPTGCGKSTLLKMIKKELTPKGTKAGNVFYKTKSTDDLSAYISATEIGYVMQRPEQQIVTDKVWHELAFGLENLGLQIGVIRRRVAEVSAYFGIEEWFDKDVSELSGGQKQLLNLASVMVMQPKILILDEPTAQLDPITASDFISTLKKLNQDLSLTIIIVEHRTENVIPICDKLLIMDKGSLVACDEPHAVLANNALPEKHIKLMPISTRLFHAIGSDFSESCPLSVHDGSRAIKENFGNQIKSLENSYYSHSSETVLEFKNVYFRYAKELPDVLKDLCLDVYKGEIFCILGGNGSGKTTALGAAAGINRIYYGKISVFGKKINDYKNRSLYKNCLAYLPQDVQTVFIKNTVGEDLAEVGTDTEMLPFLSYEIEPLMNKHPYDLSGGEQQLVALAKIMSSKPRLLLLDEPTKGLDTGTKEKMIKALFELKKNGLTIVAVTHDVEFAALCADRCAMFFRGGIVSADTPRTFFSDNSYYTTAVSRMTRGYYNEIVTLNDAVEICRKNEKGN